MLSEEKQTQSWWSTLPGIITGIATLITATGGLIVILNTTGYLKSNNSGVIQSKTLPVPPSTSTVGRFPQASDRLLNTADVYTLSKEDLKIMRNEIFARHGFIFKTPEMKSYFENQSWYSPTNVDVTLLLTEIEKRNIVLIKHHE